MAATYIERLSLTAYTARQVIAAAAKRAAEIGVPMAIAVVDESGQLKAFERMDGATLICTDLAKKKAWAAVAAEKPTHIWPDFIKDDPALRIGIPLIEGMTVLGGGFPLVVRGHIIIGGIGISGGMYSQDEDCGRAALVELDALSPK